MQTDKEIPMLEKPEYSWLVLLRAEWEFADLFARVLEPDNQVPPDRWLTEIIRNKNLLYLIKAKSPVEIAIYMYASMHQSIKASPGDVVSRSLMREKNDALTQTILFIHTSQDLPDILTERLSEIPNPTEATFVKKVRKFALDLEEQTGVNGKALLRQLMRIKYTIKKVMDNRYSSSGSLEAQFSDAQMSLDLKLPYESIEEAVHTGFLDEMRGAFGHAQSLLDAVIEECRQYPVLEEIKGTVTMPSSSLITRLKNIVQEEDLILQTDRFDPLSIPYLQKLILLNGQNVNLAAQHLLFLLIKRLSYVVYRLRISYDERDPHNKDVALQNIPSIDQDLRAAVTQEIEKEAQGRTALLELAEDITRLESVQGIPAPKSLDQAFVEIPSIDGNVDKQAILAVWEKSGLGQRNLSSVRDSIQNKSKQLRRPLNQSEVEKIIIGMSQQRL